MKNRLKIENKMEIRNFNNVKSIFFDNLTIRQTIFKNTFWLAMAEGISKLLKLFLLIYIARILGATEYGKFSFALSFVGLFVIFFNLGLPRIVVRELSQGKEKEKDFSSLLSLKLILSLGNFILISVGSFFITPDPLIRKMIWILAIYALLDSFTGFINFFFQARQRMEYESMSKILRALIVMLIGFFVIFNFPSVENLSYGYLFASLIASIFILLFFHFKIYRISLTFDKSTWQRYLVMSWPLVLSGIFATVYGQIDSVMLGYLKQISEVGFYQAAYRLAGAALIPLGLLSTSFYPILSQSFQESKERFKKIWFRQIEIIILLAIILISSGILLAPQIIKFFYGLNFTPAIFALQLLLIMAGISYLTSPFTQYLLVLKQEKKIFWISFIGGASNIILNIILIPKFSLYGAAVAMIITSFLILLFSTMFTYFNYKKAYGIPKS